jgi:hypothetical protein
MEDILFFAFLGLLFLAAGGFWVFFTIKQSLDKSPYGKINSRDETHDPGHGHWHQG